MTEYAALSKTPHALADGLMLVFQHPVNRTGLPFDRYSAEPTSLLSAAKHEHSREWTTFIFAI
jgi:hypothetical protein